MITANYRLALPVTMLREPGIQDSPDEIAALVASGDAFVTLATAIEDIAQRFSQDADKAELERLASILFYMQRYYQIKPKQPDHRGGIF